MPRLSAVHVLCAASALGVAHALHVPARGATIAASAGKLSAASAMRQASNAPLLAPPKAEAREGAMHLRGGADANTLVFALFKAIVGSGVLCLAGGMAAFTNDVKMLPAGIVLASVSAVISGYCYYNVGAVCAATGADSYKEAWVRSVGASTAWIPSTAIVSQTAVATVCYAIIIGDVMRDIAASSGLTGALANRDVLLTSMGALVLLPLCLLRDFGMLAYTSMFGVAGVVYCAFFMVYRWLSGSYARGSELHRALSIKQKPSFGTHMSPIKSLILVAMFNTAYMAHYDAPKFLGMVGSNVSEFAKLTKSGFFCAFAVSAIILTAGFSTFGGGSLGLILNNYASSDTLALLARGGMLASIVFGFPLVFSGFRTGALGLADVKAPSQKLQDTMAVATVVISIGIALKMDDLGFAASFSGALLGSCIIYVFPSIMHICHANKAADADQKLPKRKQKGIKHGNEYYLNYAIATLGVLLAGIGASVSYLQSFTNVLD